MTTKQEQDQAERDEEARRTSQNDDKEQAKRDEAARQSAPKGQTAGQGRSGTVRSDGSNQDDVKSQQPGGVSREEAGLPPWQEDEAMKERTELDMQADDMATTEDWPPKSK